MADQSITLNLDALSAETAQQSGQITGNLISRCSTLAGLLATAQEASGQKDEKISALLTQITALESEIEELKAAPKAIPETPSVVGPQ